jgi:uncharacterized repeat protein (TIGR01451 family)
MKKKRIQIATGSLAFATALSATPALADGTASGTLIQNTATATYSSGNTTETIRSNTVVVKVDHLLNVATTALSNSLGAAASGGPTILTYQVTNTGNGSDTFHLTADPNVTGNGFNGAIQLVVVDTNGNGDYDAGVDAIITNGAASPAIVADGSLRIFVLVNLPTNFSDAQTSQVRLTAASVIGTGTPGTVFAGRGSGGVDAVVGASTAQASALESLIAALATVSLTKSVAIADPFGGTTPVPGSTVTYTLVAHTTGTGTADGVHVTDGIPAATTYLPGSLTLNSAGLTDAADGDVGIAGAAGIDVSLGNIAAGSSDKTITFKVKIN